MTEYLTETEQWKRAVFIGLTICVLAIAAFYLLFLRHHAPVTASDNCYTSDNVRDHEGQTGCVIFTVGYTYTSDRGNKFIDQYQNYSSGFEVYIPSDSGASNVDISQYDGQTIEVSGDISTYQGAPQIIVNEPSQIQTK